jgi:TPP-dependent 2-oxoacid decarboxylase
MKDFYGPQGQFKRPEKRTPFLKNVGLETADGGETVATYLNKRLKEIGVGHVFAIPGDYIADWVMTLDDPTKNAGLIRVHPNNEMTATYAADGYGRATAETVGCVAFTYGVGAINSAQAVGGAFVENVPLVVINGSPSVAQYHSQRDQGVLYHHMLDGSHSDLRIFREVTAMAVRIDNPAMAPDLIDAALKTCITESKPVYIEIAHQTSGLACAPVPKTSLTPTPNPIDPASLKEAAGAVLAHMRKANGLIWVGGSEVSRFNLEEKFARLVALSGAPYASSGLGKSVLSEFREDIPFAGTFLGLSSQKNLLDLMEKSDCVVALGVRDTDFNYLGVVTPDYNPDTSPEIAKLGPLHIQARDGAVLVGRGLAYWGNVDLEPLLDTLISELEDQKLANAPFPNIKGSPWEITAANSFPEENQVTWDSFKSNLVHRFLDKYDEQSYPQLVADSGFSFVSLINVKAAARGYVAQLAWAAIGYGTGAMSGVALAQSTAKTGRRTVCVAGDTAFAETLNALGTVAQLGQDSIIFVMDNRVMAVEQWLINADVYCPDAPPPEFSKITRVPQGAIWDYVKLAEGFGGRGFKVKTNAELQAVLDQLHEAPINAVTGKPTFTLVAVNIPAKDLPDTTLWRLNCNKASD